MLLLSLATVWAQELTPEQWLSNWPKTLRARFAGWARCCFATPRSDSEIITRLTPEDRLLPILEGLNVPLAVCGHTHIQFDRMIGGVRVVNAGRVGMPFGEPGADWLLLDPNVEHRHTCYDFTKTAERIRRTNYPQADEFAVRNVLQPPSEEEMLKVFSKAELR